MKLLLLFLTLVIVSCSDQREKPSFNNTSSIEKDTIKQSIHNTSISGDSTKILLGYYVGQFNALSTVKARGTYSNKITLSIDSIHTDSIYGHSIVAGNSRPFEGIWDTVKLVAKVKEPGDDPYDGIFEFIIEPNGKSLRGDWQSYDKTLKVTDRIYTLTKRKFSYQKRHRLPHHIAFDKLYNGYENSLQDAGEIITGACLKFNPSEKKLTSKQLENMHKGDLEILRNSIYARHGYSFKNRKMRYIFDRINWYIPVYTDIRDNLTTLELENIALIKRYEQHADRYYDDFGR
jgi:hypothetical protein